MPADSTLASSMLLAELMTHVDLPPQAQRAIQGLPGTDHSSFVAAKQNAVFVSCVEGFASRQTLAETRERIATAPEEGLRSSLTAT